MLVANEKSNNSTGAVSEEQSSTAVIYRETIEQDSGEEIVWVLGIQRDSSMNALSDIDKKRLWIMIDSGSDEHVCILLLGLARGLLQEIVTAADSTTCRATG